MAFLYRLIKYYLEVLLRLMCAESFTGYRLGSLDIAQLTDDMRDRYKKKYPWDNGTGDQ